MISIPFLIFFLLTLGALVYLAAALWRVEKLRRLPRSRRAPIRPPMTVLKPVCGLEEGLEENLRSFMIQDYPDYQVVFGVRDAEDSAIPLLRRLIAEFPEHDLALVVDGRVTGPNLKASNLARMMSAARHDLLVVADSDMRVDAEYLASVAAPFADPRIGAVTCPYFGTPSQGLASRLGALYLTDWFLPSVLVAASLQEVDFCLGATMAVRRDLLEREGGFETLSGFLADDYQMGQRVRRAGHRIFLSPYVVENVVAEPGVRALLAHEIRWARTVRACRPAGFASTLISNNALTLAVAAWAAAGFRTLALAPAALALALRWILHMRLRALLRVRPPQDPWLLPLRDLLCLLVWVGGFLGRSVSWKEAVLTVDEKGRLQKGEQTTLEARNLGGEGGPS